jgi:hypothetical protein
MMTCYDDVMRTIIDLPQDQLDALDGICRQESISRAEAIRRAVDLLVRDRAAGASHAAFGLWRGARAVDGLEYQDTMRQEWGARLPARPPARERARGSRTR